GFSNLPKNHLQKINFCPKWDNYLLINYLLILTRAQQNQRTSLYGFNAMGMRQFFQLGVFRAWIEDNASGMESQDVVVILFLERCTEIERHRIDIRNGLLFGPDVDIPHFDPLAA